jgi:hypothetical protein
MAIYRPIHITFWQDKFTLKLTPEQKYFYLYLMTNSKTKQSGVYELPMSVIILETGYNQETINKLLKSFIEFKKILYDFEVEEILICNWIKYNPVNSRNVSNCIIKELSEIKSKEYYNKFIELFKKLNSGMGREKVNKEYKDVNFTLDTIRGLQGAYKGVKAETKTESETKEETEEETESKMGVKDIIEFDNDFIEFWKIYDMDIQQDDCFTQWQYIDAMNRTLILKRIQNYIDNTDKNYRKEPLKYLRNRMWLDEVVKRKSAKQTTQRNTIQEFTNPKTY